MDAVYTGAIGWGVLHGKRELSWVDRMLEERYLIWRFKHGSAEAIERMLSQFRKKKDYAPSVPLTLLRQAEAAKRRLSIVLGSIAVIILLVGGIGILFGLCPAMHAARVDPIVALRHE